MSDFTLFSLPERLADYPAWLEEMLVGAQSQQFISDLYAVSKPDEHLTELSSIIGDLKTRILKEGIQNSIPPAMARSLMQHPTALEELFTEIILTDEEYWVNLLQLPSVSIAKILSNLPEVPDEAYLQKNDDSRSDEETASETCFRLPFVTEALANPAVVSLKPKSYRRLVTFALAASVLVIGSLLFFRSRSTEKTPGKNIFQGTDIVKGNTPPTDPNVAWGWSKPDVFAVKMTAPGYLVHLSDTAYEWFKEKPANSNELRARLVSFREGCDRLRDAKHESLKVEDRTWLIERCNQWSTSIDELIARVDKGDPFRQVSNDADKLVGRLVNTLQVRSNESS